MAVLSSTTTTTTTTTSSATVGTTVNRNTTTTATFTLFQKIQYRWLGPTTAHIEYECYLLLCMILLLIATIRGLYKESSFNININNIWNTTTTTTDRTTATMGSYINNYGDYIFILLVGLVLSRHVILRIYCTFDPSTHVTSNLFGLISHLIQTTTIFGSNGHCFERSPPPFQLSLLHTYQNAYSSSGGSSSTGNTFSTTTTSVNNNNIIDSHNSSGTAGGTLSSTSMSSPAKTPTAADRMMHVTGNILDMNTRDVTKSPTILSLSQIVPSSFVYALQIPRKLLWFPLTRIVGTPQIHILSFMSNNDATNYFHSSTNSSGDSRRMRNSMNNHNKTTIMQWLYRKLIRLQQMMYQIFFLDGRLFRFLLSTEICIEIVWHCFFIWTNGQVGDHNNYNFVPFGILSYLHHGGVTTSTSHPSRTDQQNLYIHTHDVKKMLQIAEQESAPMIGQYMHRLAPSIVGTLWILVGFGTIYCLVLFTSIVFPIPDLLSNGTIVGRDANYVRTHTGSTNTTTPSGSSSKKGHHHHHHHSNTNNSNNRRPSNVGWLSKSYARLKDLVNTVLNKKSTNNTLSDAVGWIERQYSAISTNRWYAGVCVILGRVAENIIVVGILPRTQFACRVMGHCSSRLSLWELSRVLYPVGLNTPQRRDGFDTMDSMERDPFSAIWTVIAVFMTSTVLLLTQTLVLNRSYLSTRAYHALEWELVSKDSKKHQRQSDYSDLPWIASPHHQSSPDVWDGRRKYVRGEEVYYPDWFGALYRARVNSPEGHPKSNTFRVIDEEILSELGHPATSRILASLASIQFVCAMGYCCMWMICVGGGFQSLSYGLVWAMLSYFVSVHGVLATTRRASYTTTSKHGIRRMSRAMQSLQKLNGEIMKHNC